VAVEVEDGLLGERAEQLLESRGLLVRVSCALAAAFDEVPELVQREARDRLALAVPLRELLADQLVVRLARRLGRGERRGARLARGPARPKRTVKRSPSSVISQNLSDVPCLKVKCRVALIAPAGSP
jgi:hypothetical protein